MKGQSVNTRESLAAEAAEDCERVARHDLPDELAAGLDPAMHALCERFCFLLRGGADDEVGPPSRDLVAVGLELVGELVRLVVLPAVDPHLPGRVAAFYEVLLHVGCVWLGVPPVLVVEPVLEDDLLRDDVRLFELRVDDRACLRGLGSRSCVHEHRVLVV